MKCTAAIAFLLSFSSASSAGAKLFGTGTDESEPSAHSSSADSAPSAATADVVVVAAAKKKADPAPAPAPPGTKSWKKKGTYCTADDFTGFWNGGSFCGSVTSEDPGRNALFNGCQSMPTTLPDDPKPSGWFFENKNTWTLAAELEATEDGMLSFSPRQIFVGDVCASYGPDLYVNGYWGQDCSFMASVGGVIDTQRAPSNLYTGRLDKASGALVFQTSNFEGNRAFLSFWYNETSTAQDDSIYGSINVRLMPGDTAGCP